MPHVLVTKHEAETCDVMKIVSMRRPIMTSIHNVLAAKCNFDHELTFIFLPFVLLLEEVGGREWERMRSDAR